jgi:hypothetical protein
MAGRKPTSPRGHRGRLAHVTRADLEPVWTRTEIPVWKIAEALGVSREAVRQHAMKLGLPSRARSQRPNQKCDDATFSRMWLAGVNTADIAAHFGYACRQSVATRAHNLGLPRRTRCGGQGQRGGWAETISLARFCELDLARRWASAKGRSHADGQEPEGATDGQ